MHNSLEASWKDEHMPIHTEESIPDRAAAPEVLQCCSANERSIQVLKDYRMMFLDGYFWRNDGRWCDQLPRRVLFLQDFPYIVRFMKVGLAVYVWNPTSALVGDITLCSLDLALHYQLGKCENSLCLSFLHVP